MRIKNQKVVEVLSGGHPYNPEIYPASVFCDGGMITVPGEKYTGKSPYGLTWAYVHTEESGEVICGEGWGGMLCRDAMNRFTMFEYCSLAEVENNMAELVAAVKSLENLPEGWEGYFFTDSQNTIGRVFGIDGKMFKMNGIPDRLAHRVREARARLGDIQPVLLDGHPSMAELRLGIGKRGNPVSVFNVLCDQRCKMVSQSYNSFYEKPKKSK